MHYCEYSQSDRKTKLLSVQNLISNFDFGFQNFAKFNLTQQVQDRTFWVK